MPERQRALQADPRPVFQRLPRSKLYMGLFMTLFGVGMYGTTVGFYNMAVVSFLPSAHSQTLMAVKLAFRISADLLAILV